MNGKFLKMAPEAGAEGGGAAGGAGAGAGAGGSAGAGSSGSGFNLAAGGSAAAIPKGTTPPGEQSTTGATGGTPGAGSQGSTVNNPDAADWRSGLSEDLKKNKSLEKFKDQAALAQGYLSLERMASGKGVVIPNEKTATKEDWEAFHKAVGRPEKADLYELKEPDEAKGLTVDPGFQKAIKESFLNRGLTKAQAAGVYEDYMKMVAGKNGESSLSMQKALDKQHEDLRSKWAGDFDQNINKAQVAVQEFVKDPEELKWIQNARVDGAPLAEHPMFARIMATVGGALAEDTFKNGVGSNVGRGASDIQKEIDSFTTDLKSAFHDTNHAGHHGARAHVLSLRQELNKLKARDKK